MRKTILALLTGAAMYIGACNQEVEEPVAQPICDLVSEVHDVGGNLVKRVLDHDQDCTPEWEISKEYVAGIIQRSEVKGYINGINDLTIIGTYKNGEPQDKITIHGNITGYEFEPVGEK